MNQWWKDNWQEKAEEFGKGPSLLLFGLLQISQVLPSEY
jgi:hypothetical protein